MVPGFAWSLSGQPVRRLRAERLRLFAVVASAFASVAVAAAFAVGVLIAESGFAYPSSAWPFCRLHAERFRCSTGAPVPGVVAVAAAEHLATVPVVA